MCLGFVGTSFYIFSSKPLLTEYFAIIHTTDAHADFEIRKHPSTFAHLLHSILRLKSSDTLPTLWIDTGDLLFGPSEGDADVFGGAFMAKMVPLGKGDVFIPGNHDFDVHGTNPWELLDSIQFKHIVSANMCHLNERIKPYVIYDFEGYKLGITGWSRSSSNCELDIVVDTSLERCLDSVFQKFHAEKVDFIVLGLHQGRYGYHPSLDEIAKRYPEVNLFLLGHSHQKLSPQRVQRSGYAIQPASHSAGLSYMRVSDLLRSQRRLNAPPLITFQQFDSDSTPYWGDYEVEFNSKNVFLDEVQFSLDTGCLNRYLEKSLCRQLNVANVAFVHRQILPDTQLSMTTRDMLQFFPYNNQVWTIDLSRDSFIAACQEVKMTKSQQAYYLKYWKQDTQRIAFDNYTALGRDGRLRLIPQFFQDSTTYPHRDSVRIHTLIQNIFKRSRENAKKNVRKF